MSDLRIDKRRVTATLTLNGGDHLIGSLFLAEQAASHAGPERLLDVLNGPPGFLPFESVSGPGVRQTRLVNRAYIVVVETDSALDDLADDPAYQVAVKKSVLLHLASGEQLRGVLRVERPVGRDRLSDAVRDDTGFRYLETAGGVLAVNLAHVVRIMPLAE
ncbi:MAG: hypothetical protein JJE40_06280 [Vicinamibacteria bacterium]|nr:hypothetical protein [Vicinamibacteria bacterium]